MTLRRVPPGRLVVALVAALGIAAVLALATGATGFGIPSGANGRMIVSEIRGPRVVLAILTGAALSTAGAVMQGLFRNPLADPGLIGVSSGAALGTITVIVLGGTAIGMWLVPLGGTCGGFAATMLLYRFATRDGVTSTGMVVLAGVAMGALSGAITGILVFRADDTALRDLTFWTMGSLSGADWMRVWVLLPFLATAAGLFATIPGALNAMLLGEADAALMGFPVERTKRLAILGVAVAVGPVVSFVGVIGFVGVVVPQLVRVLTGPDHRIVLPCSALAGATLLLVADMLARVIAAPADVPVGVVTAAIGAPVFIWVLMRVNDTGMVT